MLYKYEIQMEMEAISLLLRLFFSAELYQTNKAELVLPWISSGFCSDQIHCYFFQIDVKL